MAVSSDGLRLGRYKIFDTPSYFKDGINFLRQVRLDLCGKRKVKAVAGGIAGVLDLKKTKLLGAKNLPAWTGKPLKKNLERLCGAPVYLENDAALAGLGEAVRGSGRGKKIVAYLTVGTGVGGARIVHGEIDDRTLGFEPGKQIIQDGRTLEWFISGKEIEKRLGKKTQEIHDRVTKESLAKYLALGLNNTVVHWSPDIVILGGSVMNIIPFKKVHFYLRRNLKPFKKLPSLKRAALGEKSGLYGALELLRQKKENRR